MTPSQTLIKARPEERALIEEAVGLGLVKYGEGGGIMIDLTSDELQKTYNVLAPAATIAKADPNFTPSVSVVKLNPDWEEGGDFYPIEKTGSGDKKTVKAVALTKKALDQIAQKAGIQDIGPEIVYFGERKENVRITWHAQIRNPEGWTFRELCGSQEWVEKAEMELLKSDPPEWAKKGASAYAEWWAKNWWGRVHRFRIRMTETKARLAAYRQALTVKQKYTPDEAKKPFLVLSLTYTPDTSNPAVLGALMDQSRQARELLYGASPAAEGPVVDVEAADVTADAETGEVQDPVPTTHGERPVEDVRIPRGPFAGAMLSDLCREHPDYVKTKLLHTLQLGPQSEAWLLYWHGEEAVSGDYSDVIF